MDKLNNFIKKSDGKFNWVNVLLLVILLSVIVFIMYYVVSSVTSQYSNTQEEEPWIVETTKSAMSSSSFPAKKIKRSRDGKYGIEFSYSMWIYIEKWNNSSSYYVKNGSDTKQLTHILHKGNLNANPNQCPGFWLEKDGNTLKLIVKMNTFSKLEGCNDEDCYLEKCEIENLPVGKWFHVTMCVINKNVDVYVNGFLKKRCLLRGLPRQNNDDVHLNLFNGFHGLLSRVRYFSYSLPIWKIERIVKQGPSKYVGPDISSNVPPYFAYDWWEHK